MLFHVHLQGYKSRIKIVHRALNLCASATYVLRIGPLGVIGGVKCVTPITFFQTDSSTLKLKCNYGVIGGVKCVTPIIVANS